MDISVNREKFAGTIARAIYTAQGFLDTVHQDIKSTRILEVEGQKTQIYTPIANYNSNNDNDDTNYSGKGITIVNGSGSKWTNDPSDDYGIGTHGEFETRKDPLEPFGGAGPKIDHDHNEPSSGKSIVCTEMYRQTQLDDWSRAMKIWDIYQRRHLTQYHETGYHWLFKPYVRGMKNSSLLTKVGAYLANERTKHLKHVLTKGRAPDSLIGNVWSKTIHPIVYVAGVIKSLMEQK